MVTRVVRPPAVAGRFYPADAGELEVSVRGMLADADRAQGPVPVALVAPHAGYVYSGPVAASAWSLVAASRGRFRRVALIGPSHFEAFRGFALPECEAFATPLGEHAVDPAGVATLASSTLVRRWDQPHRDEHCLEIQLPFVRVALGALPMLPLLTGSMGFLDVAEVLDLVWTVDTLVVVSSDLSHYLPYVEARGVDARTVDAVEHLRPEALEEDNACGVVALRGLLEAARRRGLTARCVDLRNSGDTAGPRDRVVGYGAFGFWAADAGA